MAAMTADNEVFLTVALPAAEETRAWRLQCLREAEDVRDVVVEEDKAGCGPFLLGDEAAVPPLLYAFACAAADANEDPVVTFDEAEDCLVFLRAVAQRRPGAAAAAAKTIAAVERSISDSAPLPDAHRAVHETPVVFLPAECSKIIEYAEAHGLERGARHAAHETTDVSCLDEQVLRWVATACSERVLPRLAEAFGLDDLVLADLFVARYAADGQRALEEHEDMGRRLPSSCPSTTASRAGALSLWNSKARRFSGRRSAAHCSFLERTAIGASPRRKGSATSWRASSTCASGRGHEAGLRSRGSARAARRPRPSPRGIRGRRRSTPALGPPAPCSSSSRACRTTARASHRPCSTRFRSKL